MEFLNEEELQFINSNASYTPTEISIYKDVHKNEGHQDITFWDTSFIKYMGSLFSHYKYSPDLLWNTSNVTKMFYMFQRSKFNGYINCWITKNVVTMNYMFSDSEFNNSINSWDVSNVKYMSGMFSGSIFNKDINGWNVKNVRYIEYMFCNSRFNKDISSWKFDNIISFNYMLNQSKLM